MRRASTDALWLSLVVIALVVGCSVRDRPPDAAAPDPCGELLDQALHQRDQAVARAEHFAAVSEAALRQSDSAMVDAVKARHLAQDVADYWKKKAGAAVHDTTWIRLKVHEDGMVGEIIDTTWVINSWDPR